MPSLKTLSLLLLASVALSNGTPLHAQSQNSMPAGSKFYVSPMGGFETFLKEAMDKKKVPIELVDSRDKADFEISGAADSQKAGTAKKLIMWDWHSNEQASIQVTNLRTKELVFAYSVNKQSSAHGKRSSAEACAKHLKEKIGGK